MGFAEHEFRLRETLQVEWILQVKIRGPPVRGQGARERGLAALARADEGHNWVRAQRALQPAGQVGAPYPGFFHHCILSESCTMCKSTVDSKGSRLQRLPDDGAFPTRALSRLPAVQ